MGLRSERNRSRCPKSGRTYIIGLKNGKEGFIEGGKISFWNWSGIIVNVRVRGTNSNIK